MEPSLPLRSHSVGSFVSWLFTLFCPDLPLDGRLEHFAPLLSCNSQALIFEHIQVSR